MDTTTMIACIIIFILVIYALTPDDKPKDKGKILENKIDNAIFFRLNTGKNARTFRNLYIPTANGKTTEIDLVMINEKRIMVIESKNYSGWIYGSADEQYWTQSLNKNTKNKFFNPIKQNEAHINALAKLLDMPLYNFSSYIIFSDDCTLKKVPESTPDYFIIYYSQFTQTATTELQAADVLFTPEQLEEIKQKLAKFENASTETKAEHILQVQNLKNPAAAPTPDQELKCPRCDGFLVKRNGKYGEFFGCSNFPACRYTWNGK